MSRSPMASIGLALTFAMFGGMVVVAAVGGELVATYLVAGLLMSVVGWRILMKSTTSPVRYATGSTPTV